MRVAYIIAPLAMLAAACSPANQEVGTADTNAAETAAPVEAAAVTGAGTVTAVDAAAGTVTIDHGPIAAISWPAMTMQFTAENPQVLQGIAVGDQVSFEIKSASETSTLTAIQKQ